MCVDETLENARQTTTYYIIQFNICFLLVCVDEMLILQISTAEKVTQHMIVKRVCCFNDGNTRLKEQPTHYIQLQIWFQIDCVVDMLEILINTKSKTYGLLNRCCSNDENTKNKTVATHVNLILHYES